MTGETSLSECLLERLLLKPTVEQIGTDLKEAGDGIRTHDNHVGNVVLYQLSYTRGVPLEERSATWPGPTWIGPRSPGTPRL